MKNIIAAFTAECIKMKRSKIFIVTIGLFVFIPMMVGLLMYISQHPEVAAKLGILSAKASFVSENNWKGYFDMVCQIIATVGIIGFGFVTAWVFGREFVEHTMTDLLALPVSRTAIAAAKFILVFLWNGILITVLYSSALIIGLLVKVPDYSPEVLILLTKKYLITAGLTVLLSTVIAFIAVAGKGIIAPIGISILLLIVAQFVAFSGLGAWFPWAVPGVYTVAGSDSGMELVGFSYVLVILTGLVGYFGTLLRFRRADFG